MTSCRQSDNCNQAISNKYLQCRIKKQTAAVEAIHVQGLSGQHLGATVVVSDEGYETKDSFISCSITTPTHPFLPSNVTCSGATCYSRFRHHTAVLRTVLHMEGMQPCPVPCNASSHLLNDRFSRNLHLAPADAATSAALMLPRSIQRRGGVGAKGRSLLGAAVHLRDITSLIKDCS